MFKFLFRRKSDASVEVTKETQRETLLRALGEVNEITATLDPKPAVTIDPATGAITLKLPEQLPDEALALPAPASTAATPAEANVQRAEAESGSEDSESTEKAPA